jgi:hypothetical protein
MTRPVEVHFGSFTKLVGTAVYANDWWIMRASGVELAGGAPTWHQLAGYVRACAAAEPRRLPDHIGSDWTRSAMPIGLQMNLPAATSLDMGFATCCVDQRPAGRVDVAYPFLLTERGEDVLLGFSELGPRASVRESIIRAFALRLLMGAAPPPDEV